MKQFNCEKTEGRIEQQQRESKEKNKTLLKTLFCFTFFQFFPGSHNEYVYGICSIN